MSIPFNKPFFTGKEPIYIKEAFSRKHISGDGFFTKKCNEYFGENFNFSSTLLTTSCTDALEMSAILSDIKNGDEVIAPSFTFVSTVNAFVLRGAKIIFADSSPENPNIDINTILPLVSSKTKVIVVVHYAGIACDLDPIIELCNQYGIILIEDAAQAITSLYKNQFLGTFGSLSTFSFHETKNIISGEGGLIVINNKAYLKRAEIIREKGTNRSSFFRGECSKYEWVDIGSSFLPSEIIAATLLAQLECLKKIQKLRMRIWEAYFNGLRQEYESGLLKFIKIPSYATNNYHMFVIFLANKEEREKLRVYLIKKGILAVTHYLPLHKSPFFKNQHQGEKLYKAEKYSDTLLRLPLFPDLTENETSYIIDKIKFFFKANR